MVSIVIVNYNAGELLRDCVMSIGQHVVAPYEVIVVDNASTDDSIDHLASQFGSSMALRVIELCENKGFAAANNVALDHVRGQVVHYLNPDAQLLSGIDEAYRVALSSPKPSLIWTQLLNADGTPAQSVHDIPFLSNYLARVHRRPPLKWAIGASLVVQRCHIENLGGWPEDYFMYAEDMDLCYAAQLQGWELLGSDARVIHASKGTTKRVWSPEERQVRVETSGLIFAKKYRRWHDYLAYRFLAIGRKVHLRRSQAALEWRALRTALREVKR